MYSLLGWILGKEEAGVGEQLFVTFGILAFAFANFLLTIYSREFSEDIGTFGNEDLWIKRRCKSVGLYTES